MPVTIRKATADDVRQILHIEQNAPTAAHWTPSQYEARLAGGMILVAGEGGEIRGFLCSNLIAGDWELENVVTAEDHQRQGVADALLADLLRSIDGARIFLEVRASNGPARRLYEKHGFREIGLRKGYYRGPVEDAVLYEHTEVRAQT